MIELRKISETASTITLGWTAIPNVVGYRFIVDGKVSHTFDPTRITVKVAKSADRVLVEALGVEDSGVWPSPPVTSKRGVGFMRWGANPLDPSHPYDIQMISPGGPPGAVDEPVLHYFDGSMLRSRAKYGYDQGVSYEEAKANGWILKGPNGEDLINAPWDQWVADMGHPDYQRYFANKVAGLIRTWGYEGIFNDDLASEMLIGRPWVDPNDPSKGTQYVIPPKYPTFEAREAAIRSFAKGIAVVLRPEFLICHNAGVWGDDNASKTKALWTDIGPYCTHAMNEQWMHTDHPSNPNQNQIRKSGSAAWYNNYEGFQGLVAHAYSVGIEPVCITYGPSEERMLYGLVAFMLDFIPEKGGVFLRGLVAPNYPSGFAWGPGYDRLPWGGPSGPKQKVGNAWTRNFRDGTAISLDPVAGVATITP